jgi:putative DNA primase/helicase
MPIDRTALLTAAVRWHQAGASVLPVRVDGSKAPGGGEWKANQTERAPMSQIAKWFDIGSTETDGLGLVTGEASGFLEMLELEGPAIDDGYMEQVRDLCADNGLAEVWAKLVTGYMERSGGGGIHLLFRTEGPARRNTKLACRPHPTETLPSGKPKTQVLLETRGEGGFVVIAPSAGRTRSDGGAWRADLDSSPDTVATITVEERDQLYAVITMLDEMPTRQDSARVIVPDARGHIDGLRPGDDFNERTDWTDPLLLGGAGWKQKYRVGDGWGWVRPGKTTPGLSATTGQNGVGGADRLYVFSSSTEFPTEEPLTKFWVYAELHHGGDLAAAASALAALGYGTPGGSPLYDPSDPFAEPVRVQERPAQPAPSNPPPSSPAPASVVPDHVPEDFGPSIGDPSPVVDLKALDATQVDIAQQFLRSYGHLVRWNTDAERWLVWDGFLWREQAPDGGRAFEFAIESAMALPESGKEAIKAKKAAQSAGGLTSTLRIAQAFGRWRVSTDDLDSHPWELSTPLGIVDLRTGALLDPDPRRLHTKVTSCSPDWTADRTRWLQFLDTTFQGDAELIAWLQTLLGYALVGEVTEAILPSLYGEGANGKSVLLETLAGILGDYADTMPSRFMVVGGETTSDKAKLIGKRVVIAIETNEGERFNEALAKEITGGDRLTGRLLYRNYVSWRPSHTLFFATNHRLDVGSGGTSFWRRLREIPFNHIMPEADRIGNLKELLVAEDGPAILSWMVDGAVLYGKHGLSDPPAVTAATREYEQSTDSVGRFIEEEVIVGGGEHMKVRVADLKDAYERFCRESGDHPVSAKSLTQTLKKRYDIGTARSNTSRYYTNARLAADGEKHGAVDDEPRVASRYEQDPFGE